MLKLISADIKVLGHRLWAIPLGVFLFVMMFSFIPYFGEVYNVQNFILATLIPGLLLFELLREEQKSSTDRIYLTMPISKEKYIFSKYLIVFLFVFISIVMNYFLGQLLSLLHENEYLVKDVNYFLHFTKGIINLGRSVLIIIPIYYYTRKIKLSLMLGFVWYGIVTYGFRSLIISRLLDIDTYSGVGGNLVMVTLVLILISYLIQLLLKYKFENIYRNKNIIPNVWFLVALFSTFISLEKISSFSMHCHHYLNYKKGYTVRFAEFSERSKLLIIKLLNSYVNDLIIVSIYSFICLTVLIVIYRKSTNRFFMNSVLFLSLPVFVSIVGYYFQGIIYWNWIREHFNTFSMQREILNTIEMLPGLLIMLYYSVKSSIYLLKNNRTLK